MLSVLLSMDAQEWYHPKPQSWLVLTLLPACRLALWQARRRVSKPCLRFSAKRPRVNTLQTRVHTLCRLAFFVCPHLKVAAACRAQLIRATMSPRRVCRSLPHVLLNVDLHTTHLSPLQTADTANRQPPFGVSRRYSLTPRLVGTRQRFGV